MNILKRGEASQRVFNIYNKPGNTKEPESPVTLPEECPKCGKRLGRGKVMHLKNCKG